MNYQKIYNRLIERGRNRQITTYTETHHIIPRCMGGHNKKENLVELTAREHFIAHLLLVKIHPTVSGLIYAVNMMTLNCTPERNNNRMYGWLKERYHQVRLGYTHSPETITKIRAARQTTTDYARKCASDRRKGKIASKETRKKMSDVRKGRPTWNKGKEWSDEEKKKRSDSCKKTIALKLIKDPFCRDKIKESHVKGEQVKQSKLTEAQVRDIRKSYVRSDPSFGGKSLATKYNVSVATISLIIKNKVWKHLVLD